MSTRTVLETLAHVAMAGMATLGCATTGRETANARTPIMSQRPPASVTLDRSVDPQVTYAGDLLTSAELSAVPHLSNAYDAVARLRPAFLTARERRTQTGSSRSVGLAVFVDGTFNGGIEVLRTIPSVAVSDVRLVRSLEAVHRYGQNYPAGVILVRLK
jgi:hypothetical protein